MNRKIIGATVTTPINPNKGGGGGTGQDGFSPIATVTQTEEGALIEITDKNGKTSATVENGQDGFSPTITTYEDDGVTYLYIVDKNGLKPPILIYDGKDGQNGQNGQNGQDGVSPLVTVTKGIDGHTVTIQDRFGDNTFFVENGTDGVGIQEIATLTESKADDGYSWYEIILTNGIRKQFSVKNGSKGSKGDKGDDATVTSANITNALGYTPANETHSHGGTYEPYGEASIQVVKHNMDGTSHSDIRTQISNLSSEVDAIVVPTKVSAFENDKGYLTSVPSEYVTETELSAKKYLTSVPSEYVTETELNAKGYAKQSDVDNLSSEIDDQNARISEAVNTEFENEKGNMIQLLISELQGLPVFGVVDENNKVTITSQLSGGTYDLMYENEDGTIEKIGTFTIEGKVVIINLLESALTPDDITTVFDGKGYKNGYYASAAEPFYNTDANFFCTGLMVIPDSKTFYVKGCTINTSLSHTRFGLMNQSGGLINTATLSNWSGTFTVTELGTQYYSIKIGNHQDNPYYFYFSASGTGEGVIVSHTPIE